MTDQTIAADRWDGFGTRMIAMLNASWLAEQLDLPFTFGWPVLDLDDAFHGVPQASDVFDGQYLSDHLRAPADLATHGRLGDSHLRREALVAQLADPACGGLMIDNGSRIIDLDGVAPDPQAFARHWRMIGFSDRLREVMAQARSRVPSGVVGVHLRRGDLVHGDMRRWTFHEKMRPLALFKYAIAQLAAEQSPVLVFGDHGPSLSALQENPAAILGSRLSDDLGLDKFERTIFDLAALSACARVVGAESTYAVLASRIGAAPLTAPGAELDGAARRAVILDDLALHPDHYAPRARARDLQWLAISPDAGLDWDGRDRLLAEACTLDPDNELNVQLRAAGCLEAGRLDEAEALLQRAAEIIFDNSDGMERLVVHDWDTRQRLHRALSRVPPDERQRRPFILTHWALLESASDSAIDPAGISAEVVSRFPDSDALLAHHCALLLAARRYDEIRQLLTATIAAGRQPPAFHYLLIRVGEETGDWQGALGHARALARKRPANPIARLLLALCLTHVGQLDAARRWLLGIDDVRFRGRAEGWMMATRVSLGDPGPRAHQSATPGEGIIIPQSQ